jgi:MFS family permease
VIFYYSSTLWQQVGFTEADSLIITVLTSVTNIVVTLFAIAMIDKIGRRRLLLIGSAGVFVSLGTLTYVFGTVSLVNGQPVLSDTAGAIALMAANAFVVFFGISWGPTVWVLLGEMFNNRIRAAALGSPRLLSGSATSSSPRRSRPWPTPASDWPMAFTRHSRCSPSSSC